MATAPTGYWEDVAEDLRDPEFLEVYIAESQRVAEIDEAVNSAVLGHKEC
jgi:hypothetical protein